MGMISGKRRYKYEIELDMDSNSEDIILADEEVSYSGAGSHCDIFNIAYNRIRITCTRSSKLEIDNVFYNHKSVVYHQIIKALLYYYCVAGEFNKIVKITVVRSKK